MKPILFNTEMVRAILDGRKTVTRRIIKAPYYIDKEMVLPESGYAVHKGTNITHGMPYPDRPYETGDILYVRETWQYGGPLDGNDQVIEPLRYYYAADGDPFDRWLNDDGSYHEGMKWRPSIHMPKEAARIFLRVTDVRVERLRDIDEEGAKAEGVYAGWRLTGRGSCALSARQAFMWLWEYTTRNAAASDSWALNPWVWVISFERISREEAQG